MAEVADITIEEARELVSNRLLWPLVRDFLWDFAPSIHESWIEERFGGLEVWKFGSSDMEKDGGSEGTASKPLKLQISKLPNLQTSSRVKRYMLSSLGVEPCFHTFPKDDFSRVLLLDGETLESVVKWLGALACADTLRRVTDGATVRELKNALHGVYPEVFGFTAYFKTLKVEGLKVEGSMPDAIAKLGCNMLHSFLGELTAPLRRRLCLKLPRDLQPSNLQPSNLQPSNMRLLLKLRYPEAYKLCCS